MQGVSVAELMVIKSGKGRKCKSERIDEQILVELETNNYHTCQQIADMVAEKFHDSISRSSIGRLKNGIKWLKSGSLPTRVDTAKCGVLLKHFQDIGAIASLAPWITYLRKYWLSQTTAI